MHSSVNFYNGDHTPVREKVTRKVLGEISDERRNQFKKWGDQNLPDGTSEAVTYIADEMRKVCDAAAKDGTLTWQDVLMEEVAEASCEVDPVRLREELVQIAAVATAWVEAIDRRAA